MLLSFNVQKQIITRTDTESVVCNSMNFLYAQFTFSEEWTGTKTAVFKGKEKTYNALLDENDTCLVPWEVLTESWFYVSVFCGDLVTANKVTIYTIPSGYEIGDESRVPTPDVYSQIIERINESEVTITPTLQSGTKIADITKGETTEPLYAPTGEGVPSGGTEGMFLVKKSSTDYNTEFSDVVGIVKDGRYTTLDVETENKYIDKFTGTLVSENIARCTTLSVQEGEKYRITGRSQYRTAIYALYNANSQMVSSYPDSSSGNDALVTTVEVVIPQGVTTLSAGTYMFNIQPLVVEKYIANSYKVDTKSNILSGKKWAVCGDSFTAGDFTGYVDSQGNTGTNSDAYDPISGHWKTYPWWISQRNDMELEWLAANGADFTNISGANNPFSNSSSANNYTQIANDCDYITLMFGLNESSLTTAEIGTKADNDNTTLWGAYNVVLEAILSANPTVKIGIIISDAWLSQDYHDALISIAKYWGVPYLDLRNGDEVSMMLNGRLDEVSSVAKTLRDNAFVVSATNSHPNVVAHEYRSTVIENFLRSL